MRASTRSGPDGDGADQVRRRQGADGNRGRRALAVGRALRPEGDRGGAQRLVTADHDVVGGAGAQDGGSAGGPDQVTLAPQRGTRPLEPGGHGGAVDLELRPLAAGPRNPVGGSRQVVPGQRDLLDLEGRRRRALAPGQRQHGDADRAHSLPLDVEPPVGGRSHHLFAVVEPDAHEGSVARHPAAACGEGDRLHVGGSVEGEGDGG